VKPPPVRKDIERACKDIAKGFDWLVLKEAEDEVARFRRKMHIHLCLIGVAMILTIMSMWSIVDAGSAICLTLGLNSAQEALDYAGRF
jgi:hypothetical protein